VGIFRLSSQWKKTHRCPS